MITNVKVLNMFICLYHFCLQGLSVGDLGMSLSSRLSLSPHQADNNQTKDTIM